MSPEAFAQANGRRAVTFFTGQHADLSLDDLCYETVKGEIAKQIEKKDRTCKYDGLELACWGDHFQVELAIPNLVEVINLPEGEFSPDLFKMDQSYLDAQKAILEKWGLHCFAISTHLVGQGVCDDATPEHKSILPDFIWGNPDKEGEDHTENVKRRSARTLMATAIAAKAFGVNVVNGFSGSLIWKRTAYNFPPMGSTLVQEGDNDFIKRFGPVMQVFADNGVKFAKEVHPTELITDIASAKRVLRRIRKAVENGEWTAEAEAAFGFNYDPSHLGYQGVDYVNFIRIFGDAKGEFAVMGTDGAMHGRIYHVHMKDAYWMSGPHGEAGVFGTGVNGFGSGNNYWNFRSVGRGSVNFEEILRALNDIGYKGPLSVEWEDNGMQRWQGLAESCIYCHDIDFMPSDIAFDAQFDKEEQARAAAFASEATDGDGNGEGEDSATDSAVATPAASEEPETPSEGGVQRNAPAEAGDGGSTTDTEPLPAQDGPVASATTATDPSAECSTDQGKPE
ncbi:hypothetical protein COU76_02820 [Candidatus Peregrinibacteria bacterium CG10_big_fil_rev_8_21_14_0_10_49_10]|nr:MAG: hypothetical protein COU76_02820 [Candidatus Peregrinibacteria bacterium CG10_big_fil_rev_8_21_14_0_10_49_10]